ncbi:aspartic peptidase domain-containing protein [Mycena olivaceomarginata]|nr:aspartic peptidase domain-containing protein [Mycena olivaceomarginata]
MPWLSILFALHLLGAAKARFTVVKNRALDFPRPEATSFPTAEFSIPFAGKAPRRKSRGVYSAGNSTNTVALDVDRFEVDYLANITIGGQDFTVIVDTGSVDTWIVKKGFNCMTANGTSVPQSVCAFGTDGFDTNASTTFQLFPNVTAHLGFGNGAVLNGSVGFDTVTVGGLSVSHQEFAVPDSVAGANGNGILSGLLGLAFPNVTAVVSITDGQRAPYDPFFFTAVKQKKLNKPIFSISIDRGTFEGLGNDPVEHNVGFLSFGGIPPVPVVNTSVTVPIQGYSADGIPSDGPDASFFFYTVDIQSYTNNTILDSGTTFNLVAERCGRGVRSAVRSAGQPYNESLDRADRGTLKFQVTLGGKTFSIDPRDQIVPVTMENGTIVCASGTQPISAVGAAFQGQFLLGDVFLHNVVSTFNPIDGEVTLTQRAAY